MRPTWRILSRRGASRSPRGRTRARGVCPEAYHEGRLHSRALRYRLRRRTEEVRRAVERHLDRPPRVVLDVGTADGLMLSALGRRWPDALLVGLDRSMELLATNCEPNLHLVLADAEDLPVGEATVDLVVAAAVVEHVQRPERFVQDVFRVLVPGGMAVFTTPHPFWEAVATLVGHLDEEQHQETMTLARLEGLCQTAGLVPVEARRFMISPIGLPWEQELEDLLRRLGLHFLFANQLLAAVKPRGHDG